MIKFDSNGNLPLNRMIEIPIMTKAVRAVLMKITLF